LAAFSCNVPVVVHTFHGHVFHSYFSPLKTKLFIGIERYLAKKSSAIVTISELQKHEICNVFKVSAPEKTHIIPLGFDLSRFRENTMDKRSAFRQMYKIPDDVITVGIIGRFAAIKNHSFFLEAMQLVINRTSQKVIAVLIGDGEEHESILESCRKLNMPFAKDASNSETKVVLTSWIKDIDRALAGLDIVALTSHNEGTPVSLIEAQAAGKAVISTRVGGVENVVAEGQTGFLCNKDDMQSFVNQLLRLVEDKMLRNKMADNGWDHVRNKFHYTRLVSDMKNLYNELLSAKR
jgi:glycosyltransferase involved in cell wall biosynthesis